MSGHNVIGSARPARKPVFGRKGMVVSGHPAASLAGLRVLMRGGNVIDAAIAASASLAVLLGHATSIGGDCFLLYRDATTRRLYGLNASGVAPARATPTMFAQGIPLLGPQAVLVPGLVRGWAVLHGRFGKSLWSTLFDDAIGYAEDGAPMSSVLAEHIFTHAKQIGSDPGSRDLYLPEGVPMRAGDPFRQPALARTLRAIVQNGADEFYQGHTARRISAAFADRGGLIDQFDLAAYQPVWADPVTTTYRGYEVAVMPPNSYGILLLMQLNGLSVVASDDIAESISQRMAWQIRAMQEAFRQGVHLIADPDKSAGTAERLLSADVTADIQHAVLYGKSRTAPPNSGGTSCLLVADDAGNAVNIVQSVFHVFGSQFLDPDTGIIFNNRMTGFSADAGSPSTVGPGLRPPHTLCPILVTRDQQLRYVLASPGGLSQTLTNVQVLNHLIDGGVDVALAVEAPRWCNTTTGELLMEPELHADVAAELGAMGHRIMRKSNPYFYGSAKAIEYLANGTLAGAADHRREAFAVGI